MFRLVCIYDVYMFISVCGDGACAAEPLWCCPALLSTHEAVIWIRTNPKTCCPGFAPASPAHRLSLTLHQLGAHSPLCVRVFVCMCCGCVDALCCCLKKKNPKSSPLKPRGVIIRSNCLSARAGSQPWRCASYGEWKMWWLRAASSSGPWHIRPSGGGTIVGWHHADAFWKRGLGLENATRYERLLSRVSMNSPSEKTSLNSEVPG